MPISGLLHFVFGLDVVLVAGYPRLYDDPGTVPPTDLLGGQVIPA